MTEKHYRYHDVLYESGPRITLSEFDVVRHTPRGVKINVYGEEKFVLNGVGKRFSHATKEAALHSYMARKKRQSLINYHRYQMAEDCLKLAKYMMEHGKFLEKYETFCEGNIPWEPIS